ncbi:MAG: hypothetical protein M3460_26075 [Actinomycetota bacterium]|nr:hypothetical protein [Actinomycetota bacterium]
MISHSLHQKDHQHDHGRQDQTRQQLLDEQADAAHTRAIPGDDRHDESAHPHQAHDSTVQHVNQDGTEIRGGVDAVRQELAQLRERMAVIKQEAAVEVDRNWVSPWRTPATFDLKVKTRLTGHQEYRSLQNRVRATKASLPAESDAATVPGAAR